MPELPDVTVYVERIAERVSGQILRGVRVSSPFVLRTAVPPLGEVAGKEVFGVERLGKRIVLGVEDDLFLVVHLMIAGRFRWERPDARIPGRMGLAAFDFSSGTLVLTEAGTRKRASLHLVRGKDAVAKFDRGGLEVLGSTEQDFVAALSRENHTLKRALTDPAILSGIGNAYSDEILHRARLSPLALTSRVSPADWTRLHRAVLDVLGDWTARLRQESEGRFPERVTAFREEMAVHGRYGEPCPDCGAKVQRIRYADNETNYCAVCQTDGKLLADRSLSRLLRGDWPRTLEEMEEQRPAAQLRPDPKLKVRKKG